MGQPKPSRLNITLLFFLVLYVGIVCCSPLTADPLPKAGHLLNRIAYGPSPYDMARIEQIGLTAYLEEQLNPEAILEPRDLTDKEDALFVELAPTQDDGLIAAGEYWRYAKGTSEPSASWSTVGFDDASWLLGPTGIGRGDGDDQTVLDDLRAVNDNPNTPENEGRPGYLSVYLRYTFHLNRASLAKINDLILSVDYDDGFKAYLNGIEVARQNLPAGPVAFDRVASASHEAGTPEDFDLSARKDLLRIGANVLAIQVHNRSLTSGDLSMIPAFFSRTVLPGPPRRVIRGIDQLQQLVHIRGIYARRQLQTVLAEFWENHFTTDYDKLVDYFDELQNSDGTDAMPKAQARKEAAQVEYQEYAFFYDHALEYFGDLLLYSATSPSMLVYLDNVLNIKGAANENYAREILELSAFGVDNRYTQKDLEQLAQCFTGWSVVKVAPDKQRPFPYSAMLPPTQGGVQFSDGIVIDLGPGWSYYKGRSEPSPGAEDAPTTQWASIDFDDRDRDWLPGVTGIGYGDGDDATVLTDMRGNYRSIYMRRRFTVNDPQQFDNLILEIAYDDGYVAYLNGYEVGRSANMENRGTPPAFDQSPSQSHEADKAPDTINLGGLASIMKAGENVLALQVHNRTLGSSDLSARPRLLDRQILPGSTENGDRNSIWTFRFNPEQHDTGEKVLYQGTEQEIVISAGRSGLGGLMDALDVVLAMAGHPSTAEFICIKLIQRFVSDDISLTTYKDGSAAPELQALLQEAIDAWHSTPRPGHIGTVLRAILDPVEQSGVFWSYETYRSKVKTPIEYINSSIRALAGWATGEDLAQLNDAMGMHLFTRDAPDGYSELGFDWMDTASMLERIDFVQGLAENREAEYGWDLQTFFHVRLLPDAEQLISRFDELLFQGTLSPANRQLLLDYLLTDEDAKPFALSRANANAYQQRAQEVLGLMLALPQWHFQ